MDSAIRRFHCSETGVDSLQVKYVMVYSTNSSFGANLNEERVKIKVGINIPKRKRQKKIDIANKN